MTDRVAGPGIAVSVAVTVGAVLGLGAYTGLLEATAVGCASGSLLGIANVLRGADDVASQTAASFLFVLAAATASVALIRANSTVAYELGQLASAGPLVALAWQSTLVVLAGALATFGATTLPFHRDAGDAIRSLASTALVVSAVVGFALAWFAATTGLGGVGEWWATQVDAAVGRLRSPPAGEVLPGELLVLAGAAGFGAGAVAAALRTSVFATNARVASALREVPGWARPVRLASVGILVAGVVLLVLPAAVWAPPLDAVGLRGVVAAASTSPTVRTLLLAVAGIGICGAGALAAHGWVRTEYLHRPNALAGQCLGGGAIVLLVFLLGPADVAAWLIGPMPGPAADLVEDLVAETSPTILVLGLTLVASALLAAGLRGLAALRALGVLPTRTASAVLAGGGVAAMTVGAGLVAGPSPWLVAAMAAALLAWEVGAYAVTLANEVGFDAPARPAELVHLGAVVPAAVVVTAVVVAGSRALEGGGRQGAAAATALLAVVVLGALVARRSTA